MMDDDRRRRLFWMELEFFAQFDIDSLGPQQFEKLRLIFKLGARRITKAVA